MTVTRMEDKERQLNPREPRMYGKLVAVVTFLLFLNLVLKISTRSWVGDIGNVHVYVAPNNLIPDAMAALLMLSAPYGEVKTSGVIVSSLIGILSADISITDKNKAPSSPNNWIVHNVDRNIQSIQLPPVIMESMVSETNLTTISNILRIKCEHEPSRANYIMVFDVEGTSHIAVGLNLMSLETLWTNIKSVFPRSIVNNVNNNISSDKVLHSVDWLLYSLEVDAKQANGTISSQEVVRFIKHIIYDGMGKLNLNSVYLSDSNPNVDIVGQLMF
ncbi:hypothetical protein MOSE0_M00210 [Monosporozyma servazzii]